MSGPDPITDGRYRVLGRPRDPEELLLVTVDDTAATSDEDEEPTEAFVPVYVDTTGYDGALATAVDGLQAGMLVDATLAWPDGDPWFRSLEVVADTVFEFYDGVTGIFEAAKNAWMLAEAENEAMHAQVTRSTDGDPNGALYVFAKQPGARDLFSEFRTGVTPLSPLVARVERAESVPPEADQPRAVFVLRPADEPFLIVYVVFRRDGVLAETMRATYGEGSDPTVG